MIYEPYVRNIMRKGNKVIVKFVSLCCNDKVMEICLEICYNLMGK